jgi:hypothetical protein
MELERTLETMEMMTEPSTVMSRAGYPPDPWQQQVMNSRSIRILLLCARQLSKSLTNACRTVHRSLFVPSHICILI